MIRVIPQDESKECKEYVDLLLGQMLSCTGFMLFTYIEQ